MGRWSGAFKISFFVFTVWCTLLRAESARLQDLPPDLQARLKAQSAQQQKPSFGLHLSKDQKSYVYFTPALQAGSSNRTAYTAEFNNEVKGSVQVTAGETDLPVQLVPMIPDLGSAIQVGETLSYSRVDGTRLTYSFKRNGVKEDIVFPKPPTTDVALRYFLKLDPSLEAKLDGKGNLLVYGPSGALSGFVQTGDDKSAELVIKARQHAPKDRLLYIIPAPVVLDASGASSTGLAHFKYEAPFLVIHNSDLSSLPAPVTIDPSIVVTTTSEFLTGNNEGMITFDTDVISRGVQSGGTISSWTATTSFPTARYSQTSVAYNGYLYVIGGTNGGYLNDVQYAPINANGTIGSWTATTSFPTARSAHTSVAYNGYLYVVGGYNGGKLNDVQYAPINSDGTVGSWIATSSFNTARFFHKSVAYNGYLYVIGGNGDVLLNDVQYAPIHSNGAIGSWTATTSFPTGRSGHTSVAYNGYLYVVGGSNGGKLNDVQYAPINSDGTVGSWTATTSFTTARFAHTSVAYNGYLYVVGGIGDVLLNDAQYAPINSDGTVGSWTDTTSFPTARFIHTSLAYNGYLYVVGGTNGAFLNDVQYAPINPNGAAGAWGATTSFTTPRYGHTSVAYNGYLYVVGGISGGGELNDVQYAPINSDGTVGSWIATSSFNTARAYHTSVAYNGYLYVIGGYNGDNLNDVQYAPINSDGTVGSWTATTSFTTARYGHTLVAYNGYLYVIGGFGDVYYLNDVQYAPINSDGTVGSWTATSSFNTARAYHTSVAYNGYLYVIGGQSGPLHNDVQYAPINADGTVGSWTATTGFTTARTVHTSVAYNGYLYVIGGQSAPLHNDVQHAPINADGTVGSWTATASFTTARVLHTSVAYNGYLYVIGGTGGVGVYLNDVQHAPINPNGTVAPWGSTTILPTTRYVHASVAHKGYLYVIGGISGGGNLNDVQYAPINSDGTVGNWTATNSFVTARFGLTAVAYKGYMYVMGGSPGGFASLNDVQYAPINADGTVGSWNPANSFNTGRVYASSAVYNGYLYILGGLGFDGGGLFLNDVQYAPINGDGALGSWNSTSSFSTGRDSHTSVAYNGYLYVLGGSPNANDGFNNVQYAAINPDGTVGAWNATAWFDRARFGHASVAYNGFLYVIGGYDNGSYLNDVQFAPISSNGRLGSWNEASKFTPPAREWMGSAVSNGTLYLTGGYNNGEYDDVQYVTLNGPAARGAYSRLVDLGADSIIESLSFTDSNAAGLTNLSFTTALEQNAVFAPHTSIPNATSATTYPVNECGRYVWARFDLDDTSSNTTDGAWAIGRKNVQDFTVAYTPLAISPSTLTDGIGGTNYSQQLSINPSGTYTFSTADPLPAGITLSTAGLLSGTPTETGIFPLTVTATDASGCGTSVDLPLIVNCPNVSVSTLALPDGVLGINYCGMVDVSGGSAPVSLTLTLGALPDGLSLNPATGEITGQPSVPGTFVFTITATDAVDCASSKQYTVNITAGNATCPGNALFCEEWSSGTANGWTGKPGNSYNYSTMSAVGTTAKKADTASPVFSGCNGGDCTYEITDMQVNTPGGRVSYFTFVKDKANYIELRFLQDKQKILLLQKGIVGGVLVKSKKKISLNIAVNHSYHVLVHYSSGCNEVTVLIDGVPQPGLTFHPPAPLTGASAKLRVKSVSGLPVTGTFKGVFVYP